MLDATFKGTKFSDVYFEIGRYFDDLVPKQEATKIDIPKIPGYLQLSKKFLNREITIMGVLYASSSSELLTRIENFRDFLYSPNPEQLIFNDKSDRYYLVEFQDKVELSKRREFVPLSLEFIANDPFAYAITENEVNKTNITTKGYIWNVSNAGQYYAYPLITITFNQNQSHIYIQNNSIIDCRFDISKSFSNGDVLEVDSKLMKILLNNVHSPAGFGDGGDSKAEFILLKTGNNEFEVGTDDATLNIDVKVNFRKTYL